MSKAIILKGPVPDENIQRSAAGMIEAYGDQAVHVCQTIVVRMVAQRDEEGGAVWRRILQAVKEPTQARPGHLYKERCPTENAGGTFP